MKFTKIKLNLIMAAAISMLILSACQSEKTAEATGTAGVEISEEAFEVASSESDEVAAADGNTDDNVDDTADNEEIESEESRSKAGSKKKSNTIDILKLAAKDINGNDLKLGDCITGNKVTMINVWGTFCGPCINEMPYLNELYVQYKDKGFGIVGITCDVLDYDDKPINEAVEDSKSIIAATGVTYPIIMETVEMKNIFVTSVVPVSYFVDSEGQLIGKAVAGSKSKSEWETMIKGALSEVK